MAVAVCAACGPTSGRRITRASPSPDSGSVALVKVSAPVTGSSETADHTERPRIASWMEGRGLLEVPGTRMSSMRVHRLLAESSQAMGVRTAWVPAAGASEAGAATASGPAPQPTRATVSPITQPAIPQVKARLPR